MNIEGKYTLQAAPAEVWQSLMQRELLLKTIPGIERLEQIDNTRYEITLHIKQAPFVDTYRGNATISGQQYPQRYHISLDAQGEHGRMKGIGTIQLSAKESNTILSYKGTLTIERPGVHISPSVIKGAAKLLIQQFLTALADHMKQATETPTPASVVKRPDGNIVVVPQQASRPFSSKLLQKFIHLVKLGDHDPVEEARWEKRLRRWGTASVLLLLVWIGTRLPRR